MPIANPHSADPHIPQCTAAAPWELCVPFMRHARSRPLFWPEAADTPLLQDCCGLPCMIDRQPCMRALLDWLLCSGTGVGAAYRCSNPATPIHHLRRGARPMKALHLAQADRHLPEDCCGLLCMMERQPCVRAILDWLLSNSSGTGTAAKPCNT